MMMNKNIGIYVLSSKEWFYVGCTTDLNKRKWEHFSNLFNNRHRNWKLQEQYNKGVNFEFIILENCSEDILEELEAYWFDEYKRLNPKKEPLNLKSCGANPVYSYESKVKMSKGKIKREYDFKQKYCLYDYDTNELLYVGDIFEVSKYSNVSIIELTTLKKTYSETFNTSIYMVDVFEFLPLDEQIDITDIY